MSATGFTPISLYYSTTGAAVPSSGNLVNGELAINILDEKLYFKNSSGTVKLLASTAAVTNVSTLSFGTTGLTPNSATSGAITVAGILSAANGGTGVANNAASTITISGSFGTTLTVSGTTAVTLPTTGTLATLAGTETLTNKRISPRVNVLTTTTSPWAWNSDSYDEQCITALANALTINADAGTPTNGQKAIFRLKDNGTAQALTWTTGSSNSFRVVGITLPTTTVANKTIYVGCIYNSTDSRWDAVATTTEA